MECKAAGLYILQNRIDVRWGDYSQIETEMWLLEYAHNMQEKTGVKYLYYHLISGVDIPLKSQDYIHNFFNIHQGKEFLGYFQGDLHQELRKKVQMYHLFSKHFTKDGKWTFRNIVRAVFCRLQLYIGVKRNKDIPLVRGGNWASVTNDFVEYLLSFLHIKKNWLSFYY
jgi:hypothetical protein